MGRKGNVVESVVEKDHDEDNSTGSSVTTHGVTVCVEGSGFPVGRAGSRPDGEHGAHTGGRDEEECSSTGLVDDQSTNNGGSVVVDLQDTVDEELLALTGDSDTVEDLGEVVRDETVTGPLREEGKSDDDSHPDVCQRRDAGEYGICKDSPLEVTLGLEERGV